VTLRSTLTALAALTLGGLFPGAALAWGDAGHRMIGRLAIEALPTGLPAFLYGPDVAPDVGELSREPDRSRNAGKLHDSGRDPGHFVDVDDQGRVLGGPALDALPPTRADYENALRTAGVDTYKAGYLPYSIVDGWQQLAKDFAYWRADVAGERLESDPARRAWISADRRRRERQIILNLGVWSHYVGDASQPLHVTTHFNGWGEGANPHGFTLQRIHVPFEGPYVAAHVTPDAVRSRLRAYHHCDCAIEARTAAYLGETWRTVVPFYEMEKAGGLLGDDPRGATFAADRIAAGVSELRDLVVEAWNASAKGTVGYPATPVSEIEAGRADAYSLLYGAT